MSKRFIAFIATAIVVFVVAITGATVARPAHADSISNTGPGSDNTVDQTNHNSTDTTNNNNTSVDNNSGQTCDSGSAQVGGNTSAGNATSGNASCSNTTSTSINIGKGGGGGAVTPIPGSGGGSGTTVSTLPSTGAEAPLLPAGLASMGTLGAGLAIARRRFNK